MERKITSKLLEWKGKKGHRPIVITGCRQIGKTYSVQEFVRGNYISYAYLNFESNPDAKALFEDSLEPETLIPKISMYSNVSLVRGESAIIMDEIQACSGAFSSLKPLADCGIDILCTGSFLGINLEDDDTRLSPLGYIEVLRMYSMDFEEFLWAMGYNKDLISLVKDSIRSIKPIEGPFNKMMLDAFRIYMVVGGMPAAVSNYANTRDYPSTSKVLKDIRDMLIRDAGRYSHKAGRAKINACLESIPTQISKENKRFLFRDVEKESKAGSKVYGNALDWIENAGLSNKCENITGLIPPLTRNVRDSHFKVYMSDTGILMSFMDGVDAANVALREPFSNNGAFVENAVCAELVRKGYSVYYYTKENSKLEIDFVIMMSGRVNLIEVKSGKDMRSKSLNTLLARKDLDCVGIKLTESNVMRDDNGAIHLPLYAPCFFEDNKVSDIHALDVEGANALYERLKGKSSEPQ